uniref:Si:ch211-209a2.2 n=1 Tax=Oncorhynchus mykiss TaxID=8022 RepID=A0A8L0DV90_ONCMY
MGIYQSKGKIPEEVYRFWSAVASSIRLGWLGTDDMAKEMKVCQLAIFPMLLNASALQGDIVGLEGHLQQGADVSVSDGHGRTPLHLAAGEGDVETVRFLLKKGADVNVRDFARETALRDGIRCKSIEVVSQLMSEGAHLETSSLELGVEMCCLAFLGDFKQMEVWKQAGVSFNFADADGRTPLHVAVCTNQPDMVRFCIRNGSSLEVLNSPQPTRFNIVQCIGKYSDFLTFSTFCYITALFLNGLTLFLLCHCGIVCRLIRKMFYLIHFRIRL